MTSCPCCYSRIDLNVIVYGARVWMGWEDPYVAFFELPLAFHGPLLPRLGQTRSLPRGILRLFAPSNYVCIPRPPPRMTQSGLRPMSMA
jgi:hypothetical protein